MLSTDHAGMAYQDFENVEKFIEVVLHRNGPGTHSERILLECREPIQDKKYYLRSAVIAEIRTGN
jgi:hypothetical protein